MATNCEPNNKNQNSAHNLIQIVVFLVALFIGTITAMHYIMNAFMSSNDKFRRLPRNLHKKFKGNDNKRGKKI